jgi:hypothetical protein
MARRCAKARGSSDHRVTLLRGKRAHSASRAKIPGS